MNHQSKSGTKIVAFSNRFLTNKKENEMQGQLKGFYFKFLMLNLFKCTNLICTTYIYCFLEKRFNVHIFKTILVKHVMC